MTVFEKNQYKLLALSSVIWLLIVLILSPPMSPGLFIMLIASGVWFSKGSVVISY